MHAGGAIRTIHVVAAALVTLGALAVVARPALARRYEWLFWAAALALVITGFGNLATIGGGPGGAWRTRFSIKLALVAALLLVSGFRAMLVLLDAPAPRTRLANLVSALVAAGALSLGLVIAHA